MSRSPLVSELVALFWLLAGRVPVVSMLVSIACGYAVSALAWVSS